MRKLTLAVTAAATAATGAVAAPAFAADLNVSIEIPRLSVAAYHRPYVAVWIERPDNTAVRTLAVWYEVSNTAEGKDWLKDMRTWWRAAGTETVCRPGALVALEMPSAGMVMARPPRRHQVRMSLSQSLPSAVLESSYQTARVRTAVLSGRSIHTAT